MMDLLRKLRRMIRRYRKSTRTVLLETPAMRKGIRIEDLNQQEWLAYIQREYFEQPSIIWQRLMEKQDGSIWQRLMEKQDGSKDNTRNETHERDAKEDEEVRSASLDSRAI